MMKQEPNHNRPRPVDEIRLEGLHSARGINFWSRRPVIRMDLSVGAYDEISSADVPGLREALLETLPGLKEHHCSIGRRGGFEMRLKQGTYAPHILEHVALELQSMIGHDVGYGKTRGGEEPGKYTLVFEYRHEQVGLRAAAIALEVVHHAFDGTLQSIDAAINELRALDRMPDAPPLAGRVLCGITGGGLRLETQSRMSARMNEVLAGTDESRLIVDVAPSYILRAGLPYARSTMAVILDTQLSDVAPRYQERDKARQLVCTVVEATKRGGIVICPASEWELQDYARDQDCSVAIFSTSERVSRRDRHVASAVATVDDGRIRIEDDGADDAQWEIDEAAPLVPQVVAALAAQMLRPAAATEMAAR
jgi:hypothetical protein